VSEVGAGESGANAVKGPGASPNRHLRLGVFVGAPELTIVIDHGVNGDMEEVAISEFKAKCLGILEEVRKTRQPIRVTRFGKPVAEIVPPTPEEQTKSWLGCMAGPGVILGDIVGPTGSLEDWEAGRD
jgi:prevent-host-death family protein